MVRIYALGMKTFDFILRGDVAQRGQSVLTKLPTECETMMIEFNAASSVHRKTKTVMASIA